ncbi:MAG: hypothetical protein BJ554DRAFT_3410 [Olpidium bornovanus]|uniref:Uncharacterized protein n=1 Tax=Olpidium bornovanus TaxID=278681 RepID=A0A8H7ZP53_9FUNG|nr:MAG: hypothetical protein BJ554DRAFT_3410 [Olpidium bornovanus]
MWSTQPDRRPGVRCRQRRMKSGLLLTSWRCKQESIVDTEAGGGDGVTMATIAGLPVRTPVPETPWGSLAASVAPGTKEGEAEFTTRQGPREGEEEAGQAQEPSTGTSTEGQTAGPPKEAASLSAAGRSISGIEAGIDGNGDTRRSARKGWPIRGRGKRVAAIGAGGLHAAWNAPTRPLCELSSWNHDQLAMLKRSERRHWSALLTLTLEAERGELADGWLGRVEMAALLGCLLGIAILFFLSFFSSSISHDRLSARSLDRDETTVLGIFEVSSVRVDETFVEVVEGKYGSAPSVVYLLSLPQGRIPPPREHHHAARAPAIPSPLPSLPRGACTLDTGRGLYVRHPPSS